MRKKHGAIALVTLATILGSAGKPATSYRPDPTIAPRILPVAPLLSPVNEYSTIDLIAGKTPNTYCGFVFYINKQQRKRLDQYSHVVYTLDNPATNIGVDITPFNTAHGKITLALPFPVCGKITLRGQLPNGTLEHLADATLPEIAKDSTLRRSY